MQLRVARAAGKRLDRVDWEAHPTGCRPAASRLPRETGDLVLHQHLAAERIDLDTWRQRASPTSLSWAPFPTWYPESGLETAAPVYMAST